jgi:mycothiol synthase
MTRFDIRQLHPYNGSFELPKILQFVGECNVLANFCGCPHTGDICHFLSNSLRGLDLEQHFYVYEEVDGQILGLVMLYSARHSGYSVLVHPRHRGQDLESSLVTWGEQQTQKILQVTGSDSSWISSEVMNCDTIRRDILLAQGYVASNEPDFYYTMRSLQIPIPESNHPEGFTIRSVAGEEEAEVVQEVHASAFNSLWQPGEYRNVMRTPGFHVDREIVVVAPDGRFVAFLIYWVDPISKSGLFEPVGCHKDFQRLGLTKALMYEGMRRMISHGMTMAIVLHQPEQENPASAALYRSVGFSSRYTIFDYRKNIK